MIYYPNSFAQRSTEYPLAPGVSLSSDGQALVGYMTNGVFGVGPSTGTATDVFIGFSMTQVSAANFLEQTAVKVEKLTVSAGGTVALQFTPMAGSVAVFDVTLNTRPTTFTVAANVLSALTAGDSVYVTYTYALTVAQSVALQGNQTPGGFAGYYSRSVGVAQNGRIHTNQFDTSKNWSAATAVKLGANGILQDQTGTGVVTNAIVVSVPSIDYPYLGLEFGAV